VGVAYFIRRHGDVCSVIRLLPDDREEVVQEGMTLIEAEILCAMRIDDLPRPITPTAGELPLEEPRPNDRGSSASNSDPLPRRGDAAGFFCEMRGRLIS
jgi:hypothetical protein